MLSSAAASLVGNSRDLVWEILRRLPWTCAIRFRLVCKVWRSLTNVKHTTTPCFVVQYFNYCLSTDYFIDCTTSKSDHFNTLFLKFYRKNGISMNWVREYINLSSNFSLRGGEEEEEQGKIYYQQQRTNFFHNKTYYHIKLISSCGGFLLFTAKPAAASNMLARFRRWLTKDEEQDPALILYNPITKEKHTVTAPPSTHVYCGFYYHSPTKEHRILYQLNFDPHEHQAGFVKFLVFGLQTKSTRVLNLKVNNYITPPPDTTAYYYNRIDTSTPPVISNGSLHWVVSDSEEDCKYPSVHTRCSQSILSFGIKSEEFRTMPHPPMPHLCPTPHKMNLLVMEGGILCLCAGYGPTGNKLGIYVMKDYKKWTWIMSYCIDLSYHIPPDMINRYGLDYKALQILHGDLLLHLYNKTNNKIYQEYGFYSLNEHKLEDGRALHPRPNSQARMVVRKSKVNQKRRQPFQVIIQGFNGLRSTPMNERLMNKVIIKSDKKWRAPLVGGNMVHFTPSSASLIHHNGNGTASPPPRISTFFSIRTNRSYEYV